MNSEIRQRPNRLPGSALSCDLAEEFRSFIEVRGGIRHAAARGKEPVSLRRAASQTVGLPVVMHCLAIERYAERAAGDGGGSGGVADAVACRPGPLGHDKVQGSNILVVIGRPRGQDILAAAAKECVCPGPTNQHVSAGAASKS